MELHQDIVRREVVLDADLDTAWSALASADGLQTWLAESVDVEIAPGAKGTITDHDGVVRDATVEEVVPGRRVALRWAASGHEPTVVDLTLEPLGDDRTRLVVVEVPAAVVHAVSTQLVIAGTSAFRGPALVAA
ncbi:hypothetical protein DSM112329_03850 [Paraconexibacter sp. AEG42_29]|uniref:Activator of Hsp90 ATPase homologue 1/2-like C-terminal domain-containing protein n=1 Tax=Paraconexibacter sp. AEG42_29 TaxID=2997339 RepID=A0AAU7AZ24_9ACTN